MAQALLPRGASTDKGKPKMGAGLAEPIHGDRKSNVIAGLETARRLFFDLNMGASGPCPVAATLSKAIDELRSPSNDGKKLAALIAELKETAAYLARNPYLHSGYKDPIHNAIGFLQSEFNQAAVVEAHIS